ncbi:arginine--tRNA ligase [soil metagenome]
MSDPLQQRIVDALTAAVQRVAPGAAPTITLERPKQAAHGDYATNLAMQLAKPLGRNPRELAAAVVAALLEARGDSPIAAAEVAGPGFINLRLRADARQQVVREAIAAGARFGLRSAQPAATPTLVEFVSANPTGPLHVGHGRQGALGDVLCRLLETQGIPVSREFYYNDAGVQIATLAASVQARCNGFRPGDGEWPENAYNGEYIEDIAKAFVAGATARADDREFVASGDIEDLDGIRQFAVAYLRHEQDIDLQTFGVGFDHYFLESSLYETGRVDRTVEALIASGKTYESEGALWLRSTDYGDDKDRVMRKSEGGYTYFVPDIAYHVDKWERGFHDVVNIQGSDHHGTIARVRAGLQAYAEVKGLPIDPKFPHYILHKMVTVMRGGAEVKISKRTGGYVTLRDLIEMCSVREGAEPDLVRGRDAVRFFLASRKADTEFTFDVDLAVKSTDENPVYYVQYAHARICSILEAWGGDVDTLAAADLAPLSSERAGAMLQRLADFPGMLTRAADEFAPHAVTFYVRDLAAEFHSFYNDRAERVLVDDPVERDARLALLLATRQVLRNALTVLGVSAPQRM